MDCACDGACAHGAGRPSCQDTPVAQPTAEDTDEFGACLSAAVRASETHQATFEACSLKYSSIFTDSGDSEKTKLS